tara:strand:- start:1654 stop:1899 length:246 start_codon:yes stop_codon:yes gene_type:complete
MREKWFHPEEKLMGIDRQSEQAANLQIGPTSLGMVRVYLEGDGIDLPLDFDPEEAEEIAEELMAAAAAARTMADGKGGKKR